MRNSVKSWIYEFQNYLQTPLELGGSGRFFTIPIENPDIFWRLFEEFTTRWPKGIEMKAKGYFYVTKEKQMLFTKISAISVVDKWAPYSIKYPQFKSWQTVLDDFKNAKDTPAGLLSTF